MNEELSQSNNMEENIVVKKCGKLSLYFGIEQGTQEWLDLREGKITCSNAKTLLYRGKNACLAANSRAADRLRPNGNKYAERGHVIEHEVKQEFNELLERAGLRILDCTFVTNSDYPSAGYSPDGLIVDLEEGDDPVLASRFIPLEVKAYNDYVDRKGEKVYVGKHTKAVEDMKNIPLDAVYQMQMEMLMTESDVVFLLLANPECDDTTKRVKLWEVHRDEEIIGRLKEMLSKE